METIAAAIAITLAAAGLVTPAVDDKGRGSYYSMSQQRTHNGSGEVAKCGPLRWTECDQTRVPSQANGGGE